MGLTVPTNQMGWEEFVMKTTILVYVIALGGVAMIAFWALGALHSDQGKGRSEALHTDGPNNSCWSCPDWPCPGLAPVARVGGLPVNHLRLAMPLYWLVYRHNNGISVVIEPGASLIRAR